jgi:hypothetical protein
MSVDRRKAALVLGVVLLSSLALGGCSSIADLPFVGTPADSPTRPKEAGAYLPVEEMPQARDEAAMAPAERAKIQAELIAARDRQAVTTTGQASSTK